MSRRYDVTVYVTMENEDGEQLEVEIEVSEVSYSEGRASRYWDEPPEPAEIDFSDANVHIVKGWEEKYRFQILNDQALSQKLYEAVCDASDAEYVDDWGDDAD